MLTVATVNVNGIRAAYRRGMGEWLARREPDVLLLQEVRAPDEVLNELLGEGWHVAHQACDIKGRAGVAIASRLPVSAVRVGLGDGEPPVDTGRWVEMDVEVPGSDRPLTVVSVYIHSGTASDPERMAAKYSHLDRVTARLAELAEQAAAGERDVLVGGDVNIVHRPVDIKNWKGNHNRTSGVLDEEIAYLDRWFDELGLVDLGRLLAGEGPGPYTWWSWRGKAFDNDAGWRIDYLLATPRVAEHAHEAAVDRAETYDRRFSDHAPVVVDLAPSPRRGLAPTAVGAERA
ncbi:exodeoxyribonuclease III [Georgenia wutianyii]|uniref:Exodeoxyribonuclease III n=1 Tax=Georgenia wutianyii TaxID=2585135 RepID=A0ABX5VNP1_9MICO|nr:exodeoxyribonuclease III [Georgenia wutianyii]QDB80127.1 exodeoxyribonuclease III [Georgenia wutianyii]